MEGASPEEIPVDKGAATPRWYHRKALWVLLGVALAAALLGSATQPWFSVHTSQTLLVSGSGPILVSGVKVSAAVTALALVAAAASLAIAIAGRVLRVVTSIILTLSGIAAVAIAANALIDPVSAVKRPVGELTSIQGADLDVAVQAMLGLSLASAVLLSCVGIATVLFGGRFAGPSRKYESQGGSASSEDAEQVEHVDEIDSWDQLSRGKDPT